MTIKTKPSSISDFNSYLDKEYEDLNTKIESWYPLMYYNENIVLEDKNYITMGINPSLTDEAKTEINKIFEIKDFDVKVDGKGEERFNKFNSNRQIKNKLIKYQHKLKYDSNYQIKYAYHYECICYMKLWNNYTFLVIFQYFLILFVVNVHKKI